MTRLLCDRWSITQKVSPLEQPQLNPLHDCTGPLLKEAVVQMVTEKQADWDDFLDPVLFLFRTSANPTTKFTPYSLMFNRKANLPNEVQTSASVKNTSSVWIISRLLIANLTSVPTDDIEPAELRGPRAGCVFHRGAGVDL